MRISKISIRRLVPVKGHIGFCSFVVDDWLYLGNIAIFKRLDNSGIRLVFPDKKINDKKFKMFHPLTSEAYKYLEKTIADNLTIEL
jgi:DNA-binding cell septation regulator SpoVG